MKKVLIATTALVATAGMAAAEVSFGGLGRFGLLYVEDNGNAHGHDDIRIEQRFRLTATGVAESDAGVKFEGRIRWESNDDNNGNSTLIQNSAAGFAVSSGGFRLDVGQVSDVIDSDDTVTDAGYGVGLTSFIESNSAFVGIPASGFGAVNAPDDGLTEQVGTTVKLRYSVGDFTVAASYQESTAESALSSDEYSEWQIGAGYNVGDYKFGIAFGNGQTETVTATTTTLVADNDFVIASAEGTIGAFGFHVAVADSDANDDTMYGFSVKYDVNDATEIRFAYSDNGNDAVDEAVGIGFRHSLGGGVMLAGGVGEKNNGTTADIGVQFNF